VAAVSRSRQFSRPGLALTAPVFYILLSLSLKDRHGYEILKDVQAGSADRVRLGPGTLYTTLKRMLEAGLISELDSRSRSDQDDTRRRYYRLTDQGRVALNGELGRMKEALKMAGTRQLKASS
jgi:DNA-binding PadR family transcriptional regulator